MQTKYYFKILIPENKLSVIINQSDDTGKLLYASQDGIKKKLRKKIKIWSPYLAKISKKQLICSGHRILGDKIFEAWSCYMNKKYHCGNCESCNNRKNAFSQAKINDKTKYLK